MAYTPPSGGKAPEVTTVPEKPVRWTPVIPASMEGEGYTRTLIIGKAGFGKTRLAATWPEPFCLDYDHGAGSANMARLLMPRDDTAIPALRAFIKVAAAEGKLDTAGRLTHRGPTGEILAYKTLVIDTLDACQQTAKQHLLGDRRFQMEQRDWGKLADWLQPALEPIVGLPCHVVLVAHQNMKVPLYSSDIGFIGTAIQGRLKEVVLDMVDLALNMTMDARGERRIYVKPVITLLGGKQYEVVAKDRHDWFAKQAGANGFFTWPKADDGRPSPKLANFICARGVTPEAVEVGEDSIEPPVRPDEEPEPI